MSKRTILLIISFCILAAIFYYSNPVLFFKNISTANIYYVAAGFLAATGTFLFKVLKWKALVHQPFNTVWHAQAIGNAASSFMPARAGEPIKPIILKIRSGIDVSKTSPSVIYERVIDIMVVAAFAVYGIAYSRFSGNLLVVSVSGVLIITAFMIVVLFAFFYNKKLGNTLFAFFNKLPMFLKFSRNFVDTFYSVKIQKKDILFSLIFTAVSWILEGAALYFVMLSFGIDAQIASATAFICIAAIVGTVSFLPGGIGSFEAVLALILTYTGVQFSLALTTVLLYRFFSFWYMTALGGVSFAYISRSIDLKKAIKDMRFSQSNPNT